MICDLPMRSAFCMIFAVTMTAFVRPSLADEQPAYEPAVAEASNEGDLALKQVTHSDNLTGIVVSAEPDVSNVVSFTIDNDGTLYVAETYRQSLGVEDNRSHMDWLEDDLAAQSVEDRVAYMKKFFPDDWQEKFATHHDRIRRLVDTNGDGVYDESNIYATGFNDIEDGTGAGLLKIGNDLFFTCIPDLYRLPDADKDGVADSVESMSRGYGVRFAFRGHDMHGLVRGPDGKLYWSIGDRGYNVKSQEGDTFHKPGTGGVFRCNLDGSDLELFAYGMRNPQELAFNDHGDLFSVDNNSDSGDLARLIHVMEGSDAGWRMYFQYNSDRGPWNREHMWDPYRMNEETTAKQPAYILPPVVNITDGPSGFCAYPGTGFEPEFDGRFFICDFRGTASKSGIRSFKIPRQGAHFTISDDDQAFWQVLATDCEFGPDGRFYVSDWVDGWNGVGKGRIYAFEDERTKQDATRIEVQELLASNFAEKSSDELVALLGHADRRVRFESQWALADQGDLEAFRKVIGNGSSLAMQHATWGMGQLLTNGVEDAASWLGVLLNYEDEEVRLQATRSLGWMNTPSNPDTSAEAYKDKLLYMQFQRGGRDLATAAMTYGRLAAIDPLTEDVAKLFFDALEENNGEDPALRHALVYGLSQIGRRADVTSQHAVIARAAQSRGPEARLAAVLVLRRWDSPLLAAFLEDDSEAVVLEAARAIHEQTSHPGLASLAKIQVSDTSSDALVRRVIDANYKLRSPEGVERLLSIAADPKLAGNNAAWRTMALDAVNKWSNPPNLDLVDGRWRPLASRPTESIRPMLAAWLNGLLLDVDKAVVSKAVEVAGTYQVASVSDVLNQFATSTSESSELRVKSLASLLLINGDHEDPVLGGIAETLVNDADGDVRSEARRMLTVVAPDIAVGYLDQAVQNGTIKEKQSAVASLATMNSDAASTALEFWLAKLQIDDVPKGLQLDLIEAAQASKAPSLQAAATTYLDTLSKAPALTDQYAMCLQGGNVEDGKEVFFGRAAASCRRCHLVNGEGALVGPDLTTIGKEKDRRYLLEAIIEPNKAIAKNFATKVLVLADGRIVSGIVREETDDNITLVKPTGELLVVPIDDIDAEAEGLSGMPADLYKSLSRKEIRDLVAYLATLKVRKAGADGEAHGNEE